MQERADRLADNVTRVADELEREFERLLVDCSTLPFRVAYGVLHHREDAEDVAQEALIKAHRNFPRLRERGSFRAWLVKTTWRLAIDRQRGDRRRAIRDMQHWHSVDTTTTTDTVIADERTAQVWTAIDALPDKLRLTIVLTGIEGHDIKEVARLLGLPEGTVKSRLFLARERMKERLKWVEKNPTF
jgi:RNA polymerase sigma-70 factor (ECF subfamily)